MYSEELEAAVIGWTRAAALAYDRGEEIEQLKVHHGKALMEIKRIQVELDALCDCDYCGLPLSDDMCHRCSGKKDAEIERLQKYIQELEHDVNWLLGEKSKVMRENERLQTELAKHGRADNALDPEYAPRRKL